MLYKLFSWSVILIILVIFITERSEAFPFTFPISNLNPLNWYYRPPVSYSRDDQIAALSSKSSSSPSSSFLAKSSNDFDEPSNLFRYLDYVRSIFPRNDTPTTITPNADAATTENAKLIDEIESQESIAITERVSLLPQSTFSSTTETKFIGEVSTFPPSPQTPSSIESKSNFEEADQVLSTIIPLYNLEPFRNQMLTTETNLLDSNGTERLSSSSSVTDYVTNIVTDKSENESEEIQRFVTIIPILTQTSRKSKTLSETYDLNLEDLDDEAEQTSIAPKSDVTTKINRNVEKLLIPTINSKDSIGKLLSEDIKFEGSTEDSLKTNEITTIDMIFSKQNDDHPTTRLDFSIDNANDNDEDDRHQSTTTALNEMGNFGDQVKPSALKTTTILSLIGKPDAEARMEIEENSESNEKVSEMIKNESYQSELYTIKPIESRRFEADFFINHNDRNRQLQQQQQKQFIRKFHDDYYSNAAIFDELMKRYFWPRKHRYIEQMFVRDQELSDNTIEEINRFFLGDRYITRRPFDNDPQNQWLQPQ
ncbi:hypothetical protein NH340_JMT08133 [Sarcoptes scabiei]|nr:hypothetical protein NH340_JMT08133 [Sarcoptes scabiei]